MLNIPTIQEEGWRRLRNEEPDALSVLYRTHYTGLINYGIRLTGNKELANDCIIQLFIDLWEKRKKLPEVSNLRAYLLTSLRHKILGLPKLNAANSYGATQIYHR